MTTQPRPTVDVTPSPAPEGQPSSGVDIMIHRDGKGRSYRVEGQAAADLVKGAIEKVIADPYSAEWIPKESK
jgi:hypothetical protein